MALRTASVFCVLSSIWGILAACSSPDSGLNGNTGGTPAGTTGGAAPSTGGSPTATTGGAPATGGIPGMPATGGASTGGAANTGGTSATTGGASAGGGGGALTGGSANGGSATGGASSGGAATGGSGGASTGGKGNGGASTGGKANGGAAGASTGGSGGGSPSGAKFSFFVTSLDAVRSVSGKADGFGGDLRFGEATGLAGADKICTTIAEKAMPGAGAKGWRAFLSTTTVNAIDRVGTGPWYDRLGRLVSQNVQGLLGTRPAGDAAITADLPNETGVPNQAGTGTGKDDNHDTITGTNTMGKWDGGPTCTDWTSAKGSDGPRVGHSWPAGSGMSWIQAHTAPGCEPSVALVQMGAGSGNGIGNGGGYGGFYCFALMP